MATHACIVGVDSYDDLDRLDYAEKDARELAYLLTDASSGTARPERLRLLLGTGARHDDVLDCISSTVKQVGADDLFVFYFAGHAKRVDGSTYLLFGGDRLADVEAAPLKRQPLEMLLTWVGTHCRGMVLFIVDACDVGSDDAVLLAAQGQLKRQANEASVVLLYSSDLDGGAQESAALGHGVLTAEVLKRLRGGDGAGLAGEVTVRDLMQLGGSAFTAFNVESDHPLTKPAGRGVASVLVERSSGTWFDLGHPLDGSLQWLEDIAEVADRANRSLVPPTERERSQQLLAGLANRFALHSVQIVRTNVTEAGLPKAELLAASFDPSRPQEDERTLMQIAANALSEVLYSRNEWSRKRAGVCARVVAPDQTPLRVMAVPLDVRPHSRFLFLFDEKEQALISSEYFSRAIAAAVASAADGSDGAEILASMLDRLRDVAGFVPLDLYLRRYELFKASCAQVVPYFQPIVSLSGGHHIEGFEALARRTPRRTHGTPLGTIGHDGALVVPSRHQTPNDLFAVADQWGRRFKAHFDGNMARVSIESFAREMHSEWATGAALPFKLSLNCFVDSLLDDALPDELDGLLAEHHFPGDRLVIEISERPRLVGAEHGPETHAGLLPFRRRLRQIAERLGVQFAIDDFGVERANVARVEGLNVAYVKIDRAILFGRKELALRTFSYVYDLVWEYGSNPYIVAEGWDLDCAITLAELRAVNCRAVQGYGTGEPRPTVRAAIEDHRSKMGGGPGGRVAHASGE